MRQAGLLIVAVISCAANLCAVEAPCDCPAMLPTPVSQPTTAVPVLLPAPTNGGCNSCCDCCLTGGSTGLRPGIDCLPNACDVCVNRPRLYGSVEYFLLWFENQRVPPLVALAPPNALFGAPNGVPGEVVLFGGEKIDFGGINAIRATAGYWCDPSQSWGFEASGFLTEQTAELFAAGHDGAPTNPVLLTSTDGTLSVGSFLIGLPGFLRGGVIAAEHTRLWGAEGSLVFNRVDRTNWRTDWLVGFRYLDLDESLDIQGFTQPLAGPPAVISSADSFDSHTQFYGGQMGGRLAAGWGCVTLSLSGKLAVGVSHLTAERSGRTALGPVVIAPASVLVNAANAGRDTTDRLAALSETTIQIGYQWTKWLETNVGYNLLYLTSSARVGDQVQPAGGINATDFYAQGITFGVACRY